MRKLHTRLASTILLIATILLGIGTTSAGAAPMQASTDAYTEEAPLILDNITTSAEPLTFEQEFTLRIIRQALDTPRSMRREDKDVWVCWFEKRTGTHLKYLGCARNGDLWALSPTFIGQSTPGGDVHITHASDAGYGTIFWSSRPMRKHKLRQAFEALPSSADYDREFIARAHTGERTPRDMPNDTELDQFSHAYESIKVLDKTGANNLQLESAIKTAGLTVTRYNRIVDLLKKYQSLKNEILNRLAAL